MSLRKQNSAPLETNKTKFQCHNLCKFDLIIWFEIRHLFDPFYKNLAQILPRICEAALFFPGSFLSYVAKFQPGWQHALECVAGFYVVMGVSFSLLRPKKL